jgi:RimJ/RimL family protein N-acetyltransferase
VQVTSLGFQTDLALRIAEGAQVTDQGDHLVIRTPDNPDHWWGNFLLLARVPEPGQAQHWLARFAREFPQAQHVTLGVDTTDDADVPADVIAAELTVERVTVLTGTEIIPPPHPDTRAEIRPLAGDADWRQSIELAIRCQEDIEVGDYLARRAAARRRMTEAGLGAWFGAFEDGRLLAQLGLFDVGGGVARYQQVETDPAARRRGLAGALVWRAAQYGRTVLGTRTFVIVADPAAGAIRIYRRCGFADDQTQLSLERLPE